MTDSFVIRAGDGDIAELVRRMKHGSQDINARHRTLGFAALHAAVV
jgi:hypothetical protein